jgi:hypothetical protein
VHHASSNTIFVFGGYEFQVDKFVPSNNLYGLDLDTNTWSLLTAQQLNTVAEQLKNPLPSIDVHYFQPQPRFFHTSLTTEDFLLVMGGRTMDSAYDDSALIYRYQCNQWINLKSCKSSILLSPACVLLNACNLIVVARLTVNY